MVYLLFIFCELADQHAKKIHRPGDDGLSTSVGPKKMKTPHFQVGKQAIYRHRTVDTVWLRHELWESHSLLSKVPSETTM